MANIAKEAEQDRRVEEAIRLRLTGATWDEVAAQTGYSDRSGAYRAVKTELERRRESLSLAVDDLRELEVAKLDVMQQVAWAALEREHVTVSHGRVITVTEKDPGDPDGDGKTVRLLDDGPTLQAIHTLLKIAERRAKLLGLDSPVKVDAGMTVTYQIKGIDPDRLAGALT